MLRASAFILLLTFAAPLAFTQTKKPTPQPAVATLNKQAAAFYSQQKYAQAFAEYMRSAKFGSEEAESRIGWMYLNGQGVSQDTTQALLWLQKAADHGNVDAEDWIGHIYTDPIGVPRDFAKALPYYMAAAAKGQAAAEEDMGNMYYNGFGGLAVNYEQAAVWYSKSAAQGYALAEDSLGYLYMTGHGVTKDLTKARLWYQKAAAQGQPDAIQSLAQLNAATQAAPAQVTPQQGTCAAVYITSSQDDTYGTHEYFGAAWRFTSYNDALAAASAELARRAAGIDPNRLPGGQYGPSPEQGSGCNYAHGAVAGKLKVAPGGSSMFNASGAAGTGPMGDGIYDIIAANFADSTDAAISAAMSRCQTENGPGENDREICTVLSQW